MSQVPGINGVGGMNVHDGKSARPYFKDSDSKYVRLAKERGVKDLLSHEETAGKPGAVPYNRVNWFYLEDNAAEDAKKRKNVNWTFGAPEYLSNVPTTKSDYSVTYEESETISKPKECVTIRPVNTEPAGINRKTEIFDHPFIHNYQTPYEHKDREEDKIEDQVIDRDDIENVVMCEPLPVTQQVKKATAHAQQWRNPITQTEISGDAPIKGTGKKCCLRENACTSMSKLLSFGYAQDWYANKDSASVESNNTNMKP